MRNVSPLRNGSSGLRLPTLDRSALTRASRVAMRAGRAWLLAGILLIAAAGLTYRTAPRDAALPLLARVGLQLQGSAPPPGPETPPDKRGLGRATWTAFHALAANFPDKPTAAQQQHALGFVTALTKLYPCPLCREHFDRYVSVRPPDVSSRERFLLWTCEAHNEVSKRNRKPVFPCDLHALDKRWADCGCH